MLLVLTQQCMNLDGVRSSGILAPIVGELQWVIPPKSKQRQQAENFCWAVLSSIFPNGYNNPDLIQKMSDQELQAITAKSYYIDVWAWVTVPSPENVIATYWKIITANPRLSNLANQVAGLIV